MLTPGETCWRIAAASRLAFLIDGEAYFDAFLEALEAAERSLLILAWDIDPRTELRPGVEGSCLGRVLDRRVRESELEVRVLCWDPAFVYALERRWLAAYRWRWGTHARVRYHADSRHPAGASHHQKVVVIDDRVAFVGGLDITNHRWDTPDHAPADPRRRLPSGKLYRPFHDVQCVLEGDAAAALGELARARWQRATGEVLEPTTRRPESSWPRSVVPWLSNVPVGIARTEGRYGSTEGVQEIAGLTARAIAGAKNGIFIETPYLTAPGVGRMLAERLRERDGPSVTVVTSRRSHGWLEQQTLDARRAEVLRLLGDADRHRRLRVYYPRVRGPQDLMVHSKVLVVDDALCRVGSSNMSNRSLLLDTECDVVLEAGTREDVAAAIQGLRQGLLAEHLEVTPSELARVEAVAGSWQAAVDALAEASSDRTLVPLGTDDGPELVLGDPAVTFADPVEPIDPETILRRLAPARERRSLPWRLAVLALLCVLVISAAALWQLTALGDVGTEVIRASLDRASDSPLWLAVATLGFGIATTVGLPVTVAIGASALAFGTWKGFSVALVGSMLSATIGYLAGRALGGDGLSQWAGRRTRGIREALRRRGILTVMAVRIVPVAPYALVNLVAGAVGVRYAHYMIGTLIGMVPGMLGLSILVDRVVAVVREPTVVSVVVLVLVATLAAAVLALLAHWARRAAGSAESASGP